LKHSKDPHVHYLLPKLSFLYLLALLANLNALNKRNDIVDDDGNHKSAFVAANLICRGLPSLKLEPRMDSNYPTYKIFILNILETGISYHGSKFLLYKEGKIQVRGY
jgi:hypothetical protein